MANAKGKNKPLTNKLPSSGKLKNAFTAEVVDDILQIPISRRLPPDKLFWPLNKSGFYTVKVRRNVWSCNMRPKVKQFLWRICHNALPCNLNLARRKLSIDGSCPRCKNHEESVLHCLKECKKVRGEEAQIFILCLWNIWNDRNDIVFENRRWPPPLLFNRVQSLITPAAAKENRPPAVGAQVWKPPHAGVLKINSDAAISVEKKIAAISMVCRDSSGAVLHSGTKILHGIINAEVAEAEAICLGLQLSADLPYAKIVCESDCLSVINRFRFPHNAMDLTQLIVEDCISFCNGREVAFNFLKRDGNHVAHALAKWGIFIGKDCIFDGRVPTPINDLVIFFHD
ncbi:uncharacterized protein LOC126678412 [Mercurialis annua]|uniref:uncharacterized protein LOC126678412 n=1 Tax=Mercurialis annua TaxID=3986 RepID=UPI002160AAF7|nr:uncharacterized protein LOC126678412 [Mercurialis annua]